MVAPFRKIMTGYLKLVLSFYQVETRTHKFPLILPFPNPNPQLPNS